MPDGHEAHTKEKTESLAKVGDEGIDAEDVSLRGHLQRGVYGPEGEYEVLHCSVSIALRCRFSSNLCWLKMLGLWHLVIARATSLS